MTNSAYKDKMTATELAFVQKKYKENSAMYTLFMKRMVYIVMGFCAIMIFIEVAFMQPAIEKGNYKPIALNIVLIMSIILSLIILLSYYLVLYNMARDAKQGSKVVEQANVIEKKYFNHLDQFYLYTNSLNVTKLEVSKKDFDTINLGDEINLEYSSYCKEFFGYF